MSHYQVEYVRLRHGGSRAVLPGWGWRRSPTLQRAVMDPPDGGGRFPLM